MNTDRHRAMAEMVCSLRTSVGTSCASVLDASTIAMILGALVI